MKHNSHPTIPLKPVYTPEDLKNFNYQEDLNDPGAFPYTRGRMAGARGSWVQRGLSGEGDASRSNEQFKYLIQQGQKGIDVIGDTPTMICLDPDHPFSVPMVGTQGVSLCCLYDYQELFKDIPLDAIAISSSIPNIFTLAGLYLTAKKNGFDATKLRGSVVQSPFFLEECGYSMHMPFPLRMRLTLDSIEFCLKKIPKFHSFLENTYFFSETGLTADEEMTFGFVEMRHVIRQLLKRGLDIDSLARHIVLLVNCRMDFFEEIAKIRATRRIFARMMRDEFGAKNPRSQSLTMTCHTSGIALTAQQPFNNIVRGAIQCMALVLAGIQAIEISAFDEPFRTPSPESHLVSLRTQQVIDLESGIGKVHDPLGGSYLVESLTNEMEKKIRDSIQKIEALGDPADLSANGWFKKFFEDSMERYHKDIESRQRIKVGTNIHQMPEHQDTMLRDVAEAKIQPYIWHVERIKRYKERRNQDRIQEVLLALRRTAKETTDNLMDSILEAFEAGATCGEITGALRTAYDYPYDPYGKIPPPFRKDLP